MCPLDAMLADMNARDVDFCGLSRHKGIRIASWNEDKPFPSHVQSYWFAVRKPMLTDERFLGYWRDLPAIETYWGAVRKHEVRLTKHFADLGFSWDVFLHTEADETCNDYPLMGKPAEMLRHGCPFVKRKSFVLDRLQYTSIPQGGAAQVAWDYIRDHTQYPGRFIVQNITRTASLPEVTQAFLPYYDASGPAACGKGVTAVLYFSGEEQAGLLLEAAWRRPYEKLYALFADDALCVRFQPELPEGASCAVCGESDHGVQVLFRLLYPSIRTQYVLYLTNDVPMLMRDFQDETTLRTAVNALTTSCEMFFERKPCLGAVFPPQFTHQDCATPGADWPDVCIAIGPRLRDAGFLIRYSAEYAEMARLLANVSALFTKTNQLCQNKNNRTFDRVIFRMEAIRDFYYERGFQMTLEQAFLADITWKQKLWICLQIILKLETFRKLHSGDGRPRCIRRICSTERALCLEIRKVRKMRWNEVLTMKG